MILISHRGNIDGKYESQENEPNYIDKAISKGFDVEIDVWYIDGILWLGHDKPDHGVNLRWFIDRISKLWVHCKNVESVIYFKECGYDVNYFWHEEDTLTLTSHNHLWVYPGKQPIEKSIAVIPEIHNDDVSKCLGICSDYIERYKELRF